MFSNIKCIYISHGFALQEISLVLFIPWILTQMFCVHAATHNCNILITTHAYLYVEHHHCTSTHSSQSIAFDF